MNNEPVAWTDEETGCFVYSQYDYEDLDEHGKDGLIPLYTHPVKEEYESFDRTASHMAGEYVSHPVKELTDEEIIEIWGVESIWDDKLIEFARAILRKAQEK